MINTEFFIGIDDIETKIYMQTGFFDHRDMSFPLHRHTFAEMHLLLNGTAVLQCDKERIVLQAGDALYVPANMLHTYSSFEAHTRRISFFIDRVSPPAAIRRITLPEPVLPLLCREIEEYVLRGKDGKLRALLSYICSDFFVAETPKTLHHITSRELVVEDFFSKRYRENVRLDDLAAELALSCKQTAREVKRITGNTFAAELSKRRIDAAIVLLQTTSLSQTEIAERIGYASYCGFYKAYKKRLRALTEKE